MSEKDLLNPINSLQLIGLDDYFFELINLHKNKDLPKVILLSGKKGVGKITLVNHLLQYIFDNKYYDLKNKIINKASKVYKQRLNETFPNIIHIKNEFPNKTKIDDVRSLKSVLLNSTFDNLPRFIIFDDVEKMNANCSNALLRLIEEPSENNFFILINNSQGNLLETVSSRCLNTKIFINTATRLKIIDYLIKHKNIDVLIDYKKFDLTPGTFLNYNFIALNNNINNNLDFITKIEKLLNLYKKEKNRQYINFAMFFIEQFFYNLSLEKKDDIYNLNNSKIKTMKTLNDYAEYNLNLSSVLNSINSEFVNVT